MLESGSGIRASVSFNETAETLSGASNIVEGIDREGNSVRKRYRCKR